MRKLFLPLFFLLLACQPSSDTSEESGEGKLFTLLPSGATGIDFINQVEDGPEFNIFTYRNFYNGGGVAIGDINNDGLSDIFFTANMQPNKLYLNKGKRAEDGALQFEDISAKAGIEGTKAWSTGVTLVDINADGWLDIYVCNSGDAAGDNKENELFINEGDLSFSEQAAEYGLNNKGFSTHASFFDYDGDGDLDCYLLNNSFKSPDRIGLYSKSRDDVDQEGGDKLFRNDGAPLIPPIGGPEGVSSSSPRGGFTDVTLEAGIFTSDIGFGLGVSIGDLNQDMLPDIYVSNDFWERDYLYLNNGNGTFSEELQTRTGLCSMSSMGADIADLNNDGAAEIMTTDMLPGDNRRIKTMTQFTPFFLGNMKSTASFHYQMLQNALHLNDGEAHFQELSFLAGVAATDWSWGTLMFDFDNDGRKDIFVSNGIYRDITDLDFAAFISDKVAVNELISESQRVDIRDFLPYMPSTKIANYAFVNQGEISFVNQAVELGLATASFSNGAAYGDLDNDGDLDLVVNNLNMPSFVYRNNTVEENRNNWLKIKFSGSDKNPYGIGARVRLWIGAQLQELQHFPVRSFESCMEPGLIFGLGKAMIADSVEIIWPDRSRQLLKGIAANQTIGLKKEEATSTFKPPSPSPAQNLFQLQTQKILSSPAIHKENEYNDFDYEPLLPHLLSNEGPKMVTGDVNGDGLEDFILLGATDDPDKLFVQQANGQFLRSEQQFFEIDKAYESTCGILFDLDRDNDLDYLVGAGGNEYQKGRENFILRFYENLGDETFIRNDVLAPNIKANLSTIAASDIDQDGDMDLFFGARTVPGNYGLKPASFLLRNDGFGSWSNITPESMKDLGMITDARWVDIDKDNDEDLIVVGEWSPITIFPNDNKEIVRKETLPNTSGWWNCIEAADLDQDGDMDFVLGNWGLNTKFQASPQFPLTMYVKDFDQNKKSEFIINWFPPLEQQAYPFATKMDINQQLPTLKKKILKYEDYAAATYGSLFTEQERQNAIQYTSNWLASTVVWNDGKTFTIEALPWQAQVAPVYAVLIDDLNEDGRPDIWLGGNQYGLKPEIGRQASNHGVLFLAGKDRNWEYIPPKESGIFIEGQVRDAVSINRPKKSKAIIVAKNNDPTEIFTKR